MRLFYLILSFLGITLVSQASPSADTSDIKALRPGLNEIGFPYDGEVRRILILTPLAYKRERSYPVLFAFHGAGGTAENQAIRWSPYVNTHDFILISPEAVQPMAKWNFKDGFHQEDHDDVGFVHQIAETLLENQTAVPRRFYAAGHSSGGLFCYRLAKESPLFAAISPMSCGMAKGAHEPDKDTHPVSIMQVIGDEDKSFHGSTNSRITMYSATERIELWRSFLECDSVPETQRHGEDVVVRTYRNEGGLKVVFCLVKGEGHHLRWDLLNATNALVLNFLLRHEKDELPQDNAKGQ